MKGETCMREQEYFLGFDIGTGSVGYAVTDLFYNLIKIINAS